MAQYMSNKYMLAYPLYAGFRLKNKKNHKHLKTLPAISSGYNKLFYRNHIIIYTQ